MLKGQKALAITHWRTLMRILTLTLEKIRSGVLPETLETQERLIQAVKSGKLNQRITQEMSDLISSVSSQIRRAINEAINEQVLPQIQATLKSGQVQIPNRRWEVPARRPGCRSAEALNCIFRSSSRDELPRDMNRNEDLEDTHYRY